MTLSLLIIMMLPTVIVAFFFYSNQETEHGITWCVWDQWKVWMMMIKSDESAEISQSVIINLVTIKYFNDNKLITTNCKLLT